MPYRTQAWTDRQLKKMNQVGFMVDFLDTFKISPVVSDSDETVEVIAKKLHRVEEKLEK